MAAAQHGELQAGAVGVYASIPPASFPPGRSDPGVVHTDATLPTPLPDGCPSGFASLPASGNETFYPWFTRNSAGGYDGRDLEFGYDVADAIPAGGDPAQTQYGAPATAANIAGHVVGVDLSVLGPGLGGRSGPGIPAPPLSGSCDGGAIDYGFSQPFIAGDNPPPPPPAAVLDDPPSPLGTALLAQVSGRWRIGTVDTLPGPGGTARTFVHIPTCAWLDTDVPAAPVQLHAVKTASSAGYTLFLVYNLTVTPGSVTWDWGDGSQSTSLDAATAPPAGLPAYDATTQTWSNPCSVSHEYATVTAAGRTITATETLSVGITVSWSDGVSAHTRPVACEPRAGGDCTLTVGPAQGWQSGPHPVDQIEPVPFQPNASA